MSRPRKIFAPIIIALMFTSLWSAQTAENLEAGSKNSLWKVKSENNTIYLQGSVHLLKSDNYPLDPSIEKAFETSQVLVLEADLRTMSDPKVQQLMITKGMLPQGYSLEDRLSRGTFELAKKEMQELSIDISAFMQFKPWMFAMSLVTVKLQKLGFTPEYGVDMYFLSRAIKSGKKIVGLETLEYQIDLFDTLTPTQQDALVLQTLKDLDIIEERINSIVMAWSSGDVKTMEEIMVESFKEYPTIYALLITKRNENWVSQIETLLHQTDNYMIVVGALHLVGENGLVELLRRKGYTVEQL